MIDNCLGREGGKEEKRGDKVFGKKTKVAASRKNG